MKKLSLKNFEITPFVHTSLAQFLRLLTGFVLIKLIILFYGAEGLGEIANFLTLVVIVTVMAAGGISYGITKHIAEKAQSPFRLLGVLKSAFSYSLIFSAFFMALLLIFAKPLSLFFFNSVEYQYSFYVLALFQTLYAFSVIILGTVNGLKDTQLYYRIHKFTYVFAMVSVYFLVKFENYSLVILASMVHLPLIFIFCFLLTMRSRLWPIFIKRMRRRSFSKVNFKYFTFMVLLTSITAPIVEIVLRKQIESTTSF